MSGSTVGGVVAYLDKEMNIMGILSVFSVVVAGGVVDRTAGATVGTQLAVIWLHSAPLVMSGAFWALMSAFLFYRERSLLAWYVGQIAIAEAADTPARIRQLLVDVDGWDVWIYYRQGFLSLYCAFLSLALAVGRVIRPDVAYVRQRWLIAVPAGVLIILAGVVRRVFIKYRLHDESPWKMLWIEFRASKGSR